MGLKLNRERGINMDKYLIKNTTRAQREQIVKDALGYSEVCCEDGGRFGYDFYEPYINGEKELAQINQEYRASYISENKDRHSGGCGYYK